MELPDTYYSKDEYVETASVGTDTLRLPYFPTIDDLILV